MKKLIQPTTCFISLILALVSLISWAALQSQAAPPVSEGHPVQTSSSSSNSPRSEPDPATQARLVETYGKLPLSFEANQGQVDEQVKFLFRGKGYTLFLTSTEAVLLLEARGLGLETSKSIPQVSSLKSQVSNHVLRMKLIGANPEPKIVGLNELPGKSNYLMGRDPQKWHTQVSTYTRIQYRDIYPGVDLIYYGNQQQLEYDFVVAPGADPKAITLAFEGADNIEIDPEGNLILQLADDEIRFHKPQVYQEIHGTQQVIPGDYVFLNNGPRTTDHRQPIKIGFQVAAYDTSKPLVIDPVLSYSTYLGGSGHDEGRAIAVDTSGNTYVVGTTGSIDFPTANALQPTDDGGVFVTKLSPTGSAFVYSTYLGGSDSEFGNGITVDAEGNAYVVGTTLSPDFPTTVGAFDTTYGTDGTCNSSILDDFLVRISDVFVTKLNPTGSALVYSTFLGGSKSDLGNNITVDVSGNAYVIGDTDSTDFPIIAGAFDTSCGTNDLCDNDTGIIAKDVFVTKLSPVGSTLIFSTYLGGSGGRGDPVISIESGKDIAVDAEGNVYVTGVTDASNFPTTVGAFDISCGANGFCDNFSSGGIPDAFVTKLNPIGSALVYSTYVISAATLIPT